MTRSADVDDYESSVMETAGYGPGTVSFYWRVSSEDGYDYLEFYVDDVRQNRISGSVTSWPQKSYNVTGEGKRTFKWRYIKDSGTSEGDDRGYVDYLQWTGDAAPESSEWAGIEYPYDSSGRRIAQEGQANGPQQAASLTAYCRTWICGPLCRLGACPGLS